MCLASWSVRTEARVNPWLERSVAAGTEADVRALTAELEARLKAQAPPAWA